MTLACSGEMILAMRAERLAASENRAVEITTPVASPNKYFNVCNRGKDQHGIQAFCKVRVWMKIGPGSEN